MKTFTRRGYGRIYVQNNEDINKVHAILRHINEYEYLHYFPSGLVTTFDNYPELVELHKFDEIDIDQFTITCWIMDIPIFCLDNGKKEYLLHLDIEKTRQEFVQIFEGDIDIV